MLKTGAMSPKKTAVSEKRRFYAHFPAFQAHISQKTEPAGLEKSGGLCYNKAMKDIYIILSHTRSVISRIIRVATGDAYTHASIGFEDDPNVMYSFGRLFPHNPFWSGFVQESPDFGTMKRFRDADVAVLRISVQEDEYERIRGHVLGMYSRRRQYGYNYIGLLLAKFGITYRWQNHYYCSEFLKELLEKFGLVAEGELSDIARPVEFLNLRRVQVIYTGSLWRFALSLNARGKALLEGD